MSDIGPTEPFLQRLPEMFAKLVGGMTRIENLTFRVPMLYTKIFENMLSQGGVGLASLRTLTLVPSCNLIILLCPGLTHINVLTDIAPARPTQPAVTSQRIFWHRIVGLFPSLTYTRGWGGASTSDAAHLRTILQYARMVPELQQFATGICLTTSLAKGMF